MSLDPRLSVPSERASAIENELPAYRAVSATAVVSLIFGMLAIFSFVDLWFLVCGALAIALGLWADAKIRRYPDLLTGQRLARVGVGLGLVFVLSASTVHVTQALVLRRSAARFGTYYAKVLKASDLPHAVWYRQPESARKKKTADEFLKDIQNESRREPMMLDSYMGPVTGIQKRLQQEHWSIRYREIEESGYDRVTPYAFLLFEMVPPAGPGKSAPEYAVVDLRSETNRPGFHWYIQDMKYPYQRRTHQLPVKGPEDEHGHGH